MRLNAFLSGQRQKIYLDHKMIVHLIDGTYELFRHFYGLRRFNKGKDRPYGAVVGVLQTVLQMIENGDTYLGVATDHVIIALRPCLANPKVQGRLGFICMNCGLLKIALVSALIVPHRLWRTPSKRGKQRL